MSKTATFKKQWIIDLIKEQDPERFDLIEQLESLEVSEWFRQGYVRFVSSVRANQAGSPWQHQECVELEHPTEGTIILDVLKDGRIGGIEFLNYIEH